MEYLMNKQYHAFSAEKPKFLEILRIQSKQSSTNSLKFRQSSSSLLRCDDSALRSPILFRSNLNKDSGRSIRFRLRIQQLFLSQYFSCNTFNTNSAHSSLVLSLTKTFLISGLLGGSRSSSSRDTFASSELNEQSVASKYQEKLAAEFKNILEFLDTRKQTQISQGDLGALNQINVCSDKHLLVFISSSLTENHKATLMNIARIRKLQCKVASANSISILNYGNFSFEKLNLRGVFIEGADLSGANLKRADLSGSKMKEYRQNKNDTLMKFKEINPLWCL